jgi:hypothetical protein
MSENKDLSNHRAQIGKGTLIPRSNEIPTMLDLIEDLSKIGNLYSKFRSKYKDLSILAIGKISIVSFASDWELKYIDDLIGFLTSLRNTGLSKVIR